jgi:Tfp pilus assembly PilM family ATPase
MTRALGIDIGQFSIKIAEIEVGPRGQSLLGLYELPRASDQSPGAQLREFLQVSGISGERIALGLGNTPVYVKRVDFPFSDQKRLKPAVLAELEDSLPFEIGDHILDIRHVRKLGRLHRYIVGLCPPKPVETYNRWAEEANVMPAGFYLDSEALGQLALSQCLPVAREGVAYVVCDLGHSSTKLAICLGCSPQNLDRRAKAPASPGEIVELRTLNHGSGDLVSWIRDRKNVSEDDARQWLIHRAEIKSDGDQGSVSDELKVAIRPVIVELYQTLQFFRGKTGLPPAALYLTGGMSDIRGLREFMSEELRIPVHPWPISSGFNTENLPLSPEKERSFAVAIAIAHRFALRKPVGWLNFRRSPQANKRILSGAFERLMNTSSKPLAAGLLVAFVFVWAYSIGARYLMSKDSAQLNKELVAEFMRLDRERGKHADRFVSDTKRAREIFEEDKKKKLVTIKQKRKTVAGRSRSDILLDPTQLLPQNVKLKEFNVNGQGFDSTFSTDKPLSSDQLAKMSQQLKSGLGSRGYASIDVQNLAGQGVRLRGMWKGGSEP